MKIKYFLGIFAFASAALTLASCNDDDVYDVVGNPDNIVYVNIAQDYPENMPKNTYAYTLYQTPVGPVVASSPEVVEFYVTDTKSYDKAITATFEIDYNTEVSGYTKFPENSGLVITLSDNKVTIPAGSNRSNAVTITIDDSNANWDLFTEDAYLLPIKITSSTEGGKVSEELNMAYIGVNVDHKDGMLNPDATYPTGTRISDTSGFSGTISAPAYNYFDYLSPDIFDGSNWSYDVFVPNHADGVHEEVIVTIDLGKEYNISACLFQYYYYWYTIQDGTISTSLDGENFTEQGTLTFSNYSYNRYFVFWAPFAVRYIKLVSHSYYSGTGEGTVFADFSAYE